MAQRGVWQLRKLVVNYCDFGGSSRGARCALSGRACRAHLHHPFTAAACCSPRREFVQAWLPRFKEENPQLEVEEVMRRGRHPFLLADYRE
jgi:large subunit ribosomal protein L43